MKCVICKKGETAAGKATATLNRNGATIVIKNVPAEICRNCGEEYVDSKITAALIKTADETAKHGTLVDVREYLAA